MVDGAETRHHLDPLRGPEDRAARTLQASDRGIPVEADDEHVPEGTRGSKVADVSRM